MSLSPELKRRAEKLARQVMGALETATPSYQMFDLIEEVKEIVGKRYCLLCFKKFEQEGDRCYCDPIYDE